MNRLVLLLIASSQCGCIGFSVVYPDGFKENYEQNPFHLPQHWSKSNPRENIEEYFTISDPITIERLPDGSIRYYYEGKITWTGIVISAIIPIPLLIPIGRDYIAIRLKEDLLISEELKYSKDIFWGCRHQIGIYGINWILGKSSYFQRKKRAVKEYFSGQS